MSKKCLRTVLVIAAVGLSALLLGAGGETRIAVVKDNSIVLVDREWEDNAGSRDRIRIKGNQHLVAMAFDTQALKGKVVKSAELVCVKDSANISGVTISSIQAPWDEMKSNSLTSGASQEKGWGLAGTMFPAVTGGNSFSLVCQAKSDVRDGAYHWKLDPDLVNACAVGASFGITLHEFDADYSRNPMIFSREARGREPYILVTFGGPEPKPEPAAELKVTDSGDADSMRLSLRAPKNGFAYRIEVNGAPLPRWDTPFVRPGEVQVVPIRDVALKPGATATIKVVTVNRTGEESAPATVTATVPNPPAPPAPEVGVLAKASGAVPAGIVVLPALDKMDEAGKPVGPLPAVPNEVFNGAEVSLAAAKGEVVSFQALIKGTGKVKVSCDVPGMRVDVFRALYVDSKAGRIPDPLVPCDEIELSPDVATPVCVDVYVPASRAPGPVAGTFSLSDGRKLPVRLRVRNFAIPGDASFACEMNGYGLPDKASEYDAIQDVAYDLRVHANILHYSHSTAAPGARKSNMDMVMSDGRRMDEKRYNDIAPGATHAFWGDFTSVFGPILSGERYKSRWRGPVPPGGFYLTFHESWPLNVRACFNGNPDAYEAFKEKPVYSQTFVTIMKDFISHAKAQGWTKAGFQVYLNNKGSLNDAKKNPWILDEPASYWDYRALRYFGELVKEAKGPSCPLRLRFRIDISRPEFDRGQLANIADLWVVSSDAFRKYHRIVIDRHEREGLAIWTYGATNKVEDSNRITEAWVLDAWLGGASGIVPWQTVNKDGSALKKADQLGLFIFDKDASGKTVIRHSMRLIAYRDAEQLIEYLELMRRKLKLTDGQMRAFVDRYVTLSGSVTKAYEEDAGTAEYSGLTPESFRRLREATATLIEQAP